MSRPLSSKILSTITIAFSAVIGSITAVNAQNGYDSLPNPAWVSTFCRSAFTRLSEARTHEQQSGNVSTASDIDEIQTDLANACAEYEFQGTDFSAWSKSVSELLNRADSIINARYRDSATFDSISDIPHNYHLYATFLPAGDLNEGSIQRLYSSFKQLGVKLGSNRAAIWLSRRPDHAPDKTQMQSACADYLGLFNCSKTTYLFVSKLDPTRWQHDPNPIVINLSVLDANQSACFFDKLASGANGNVLTFASASLALEDLQKSNILVKSLVSFSAKLPFGSALMYIVTQGQALC